MNHVSVDLSVPPRLAGPSALRECATPYSGSPEFNGRAAVVGDYLARVRVSRGTREHQLQWLPLWVCQEMESSQQYRLGYSYTTQAGNRHDGIIVLVPSAAWNEYMGVMKNRVSLGIRGVHQADLVWLITMLHSSHAKELLSSP